jgi:transposase, IS5 family
MRPKERRGSGRTDLFRGWLDQIVNMGHRLAKLGRAVDWRFLEERFGAAYSDEADDLSDEALCERWVENPYFQLF